MNFETAPTSAATEERKGSNDTSGAAGGGSVSAMRHRRAMPKETWIEDLDDDAQPW